MKKILLSLIAAVSITSCAFGPYLTYNVGLSNGPPGGPGKEKVRHGAAEKPAQGGTQKDSAKKERGKGDLIWETSLLRKRTRFVSTTPAAAPG